ncbi:hypothetical protein D3C87_1298730 [compost metagenome]
MRAALLFGPVQHLMVRHDQVRELADLEVRKVDALGFQLVQLGDEGNRIDHRPVAHDAKGSGVEDARRHQMELVDLLADRDRVARVVAAREADDDVGGFGQQIGDLALPFIAPLGSDDGEVGHGSAFFLAWITRRGRW